MKVKFSVGPEPRDKVIQEMELIPERHDYINIGGFVSGYVYSKIWHIDMRFDEDVIIIMGKWSEKERDYVPGFVVDLREALKDD
jgi:hypothetical protein